MFDKAVDGKVLGKCTVWHNNIIPDIITDLIPNMITDLIPDIITDIIPDIITDMIPVADL